MLEAAAASPGFAIFRACYGRANRNSPAALAEYSGKVDRADLLVELKALVPGWAAAWDARLCDHDADLNGLIDEDEWLDTLAREPEMAAAVAAAPPPAEPAPPPAEPPEPEVHDTGKHVAISDVLSRAVSMIGLF